MRPCCLIMMAAGSVTFPAVCFCLHICPTPRRVRACVLTRQRIVEELMSHLMVADPAIREEMVLKIAIVAEKYAKDLTWYVENILQLINHAGDFVSDDIWHRLIQIVTNNKGVQAFAADKLLTALRAPQVHETLVKVRPVYPWGVPPACTARCYP